MTYDNNPSPQPQEDRDDVTRAGGQAPSMSPPPVTPTEPEASNVGEPEASQAEAPGAPQEVGPEVAPQERQGEASREVPPAGGPGAAQRPYEPQQTPPWGDPGQPYGQPGWSGQGYYNPGSSPWQGYSQPGNQWPGSQWQSGGYPGWQGQNRGYQWSGGPGGAAAPQEPKPKKKRSLLLRVASLVLAVTVVGFAGYGVWAASTLWGASPGITSPLPSPNGPGSGNAVPDLSLNNKPPVGEEASPEGVLSPKEIYTKVSPSVVGIVSYLGSGVYGPQAQGSGIIMTSDGYIMTNAHVVEGATRVEIILVNGDNFDAQVIGTDRQSDLAVLRAIGAQDLVPAELGNSAQLEVGERVCAIGNPSGLALQSTLTVGYVSALDRMVSAGAGTHSIRCIQTDAAINPGNSGGALINEYGQVVGVNSIKVIDVDYEGIGFAIPINDALPILEDLIANGKVTGRAMLGITAAPVLAEEAQAYSIPLGLWVKGFAPGADIATKGVQIDDIITQIDGVPVYSLSDCTQILEDLAPGDEVSLTVYRMEGAVRNQTFNVDVVLTGS